MEHIFTSILGIVCIIIGISNRKGNISSLHSYHRKRVSEEDRLPFGKLVGFGTIICGVALLIMGGMSYLAEILLDELYLIIGSAVLIVGLAVGIGISFYAMFKYNKGIF